MKKLALAALLFALPIFAATGTGTVKARMVGPGYFTGFDGTGTIFQTELAPGMNIVVNGVSFGVIDPQSDTFAYVQSYGTLASYGLAPNTQYTWTYTTPANATPTPGVNGILQTGAIAATPEIQSADKNEAACFIAMSSGNPYAVTSFKSEHTGDGIALMIDGMTSGGYAIQAAAASLNVFTVDHLGTAWSASSFSVGVFPGAVTWTSGAGAPTAPCPDATYGLTGSIYSRTDSSGAGDAYYVCTGAGWQAK